MNAHAEIKQDKHIKQMTIDCAELLAALKWVNIVTPARVTIPVISQAKFEISGKRLTISTTDLDIEASETLACNAKGRWAFVANGVRLVKLLRGLSGPVAFEVDTKKQKLTLSVEGITLRANLMSPPEDFPTSMLGNSSKPMGKVKISEATLHHALKLVAPCISQEQTRYYLNGIFWTAHEGKSRFVATDGHRLAALDLDVDQPPFDYILPRIALPALRATLKAGGNEEVTISWHQNRDAFEFRIGERSLRAKVIDGTYPDYTRVIPPVATDLSLAKIDVVVPKSAITRLHGLCPYNSADCRVSQANGTLSIAGVDMDGDEVTVKILPEGKPGPDIGFNSRYLAEFSRLLGDLRLLSVSGGDPGVLRAESEPNLTAVLMPLRL